MAFILLHVENGFCDHEPNLFNVHQIASVMPLVGSSPGRNHLPTHARVCLVTGATHDVRETMETIIGLLREASGGGRIPGTGPQIMARSAANQ